MCRINKINLIIFSVLVVVFILNCVKREHSNPLDPKYVIPGSGPAAPSLSMPTNGSSIGYNKPLFKWSEVDRVGSYELFVADTSGLMVLQHNDLTISYYTASNPLSDRKYFWKVRSRDGLGNWGGWSATWSFTIDTHGPVGPSLSIPENGATIGNNKPSFEWNDVSDAVIYEIFVANNHNSKVIQDSSLIISRYIESSVLSDGKYTWRVRCRDGAGNWGEWSATWSFTIKSAIIASPDPLVFGNVPLGQSKDLTLSISNPSDAVLNVTNITSTNTQFSVTSGTSFSVAVGSSQNVTIRFTPPSKGNQSGELSISNNSSVNPKTVSLSGNGTAPIIAVLPDPLAFGSVPLGQSKDLNLSTSNPGDAVLTVTNITSTNAQFSVTSGTSFSMESGSSKNVTVRFTPSLVGIQNGELNISNNSTVNPKTISLSGTGTVPTPIITAFPDPLVFGSVFLGQLKDLTLNIMNPGNVALNVTNITSTSNQFSVTSGMSFSVAAGSSQNVTVRFTPSSGGSQSSVLSIANNSSVNPKTVNLSGTGNDKVATPTFNPSPGNYTSAQNVTISCTTLGATIHYTTNGADPIESDPVLNGGGSVAMSSTTTLKARGYKNGWVPSDITSGIYSIYPNTVMDIDGNIYHTVTIGSQVWMAENLKVTHYRNGDPIPNVTVDADWGHLATGKYCNYNNDFNNAAVYGSLYNWYSVNDSRNIAPAGWHVPSDAEWQTLIDYLGGSDVAGGKMKETGTTHWQSPNTGATNESDFSAMPCGYRYYTGSYNGIGEYAFYWSSSMYAKLGGLGLELEYNNSAGTRLTDDERHGFSIRCIKD